MGEIRTAWGNDADMLRPDQRWAGYELLESLLAGIVDAPYRDLCAVSLWALLKRRRALAHDPEMRGKINQRVVEALSISDLMTSEARVKLESVAYIVDDQ